MPLPPITRFTAVDTKASQTNNNNGLYAPELTQAQIDAIPTKTKHNGGIWYNTAMDRLETVVKNTVLPIPAGVGGGDVIGPGASTIGNIAIFADKTGTTIADGNISIDAVVTTAGGASDDNLASFTGGANRVVQDSGIAKADVITGLGVPADDKLAIFTGGAGRKIQASPLVADNIVTNTNGGTDRNIVIFDGNTGKIIQESGVSITKVPAVLFRSSALSMAPVDVNEIGNLGHIRFINDVSSIYVDTLTSVRFFPYNDQVCSVFTSEIGSGGGSTSESALLEIHTDSGALLLSRLTTSKRDSLATVSGIDGTNGMLLFNTDSLTFEGYDGTDWRTLPQLNTDGTLTVADPLTKTNAATKNYVDTAISSIPAASITLTGNVTASGFTGSPITTTLNMTLDEIKVPVNSLDLNSQNIVNLLDPVNAQDAATKAFVEAAVSGIPTATVTLSGDVTGSGLVTSPISTTLALTLDQIKAPTNDLDLNNQNITNLLDPTAAQEASTKNYVDTRNIALSGAVSGSGLLGTTISTVLANITTSQITDFVSAVTAFRLDQFAIPTANINLNNNKIINLATPTASTDGANKDYVDTRTITLSGAVTGSGALGTTISTTLTNINTSQITNFNAAVTDFRLDQFAAPTASLNLNSQKIINLATPTLTGDATNKGYVDTAISGSGFAPGLATYIVQTAISAPTNAQVLGALSTGLLKNATTTGILSIATAGLDYYSPGNPTTILNTGTNFFIGTNAGNITLGGTNNLAVGNNVLSAITGGNSNIAIGNNALNANLTGGNNLAIGLSALSLNTASDNLAIGSNALQNNTTGNKNLAIGEASQKTNVSGANNLSIGYNSLATNSTGSNNTAGGTEALNANLASNNTAFGYFSAKSNSTGSQNSSFGYLALQGNVGGSFNCAFGAQALLNNDGDSNCAFGTQALLLNSTGLNNCAFGAQALRSSGASSQSSAFGYAALTNNSAYENSVFGYLGMQNNTSGTQNCGFGNQVMELNLTGSFNTSLGYKAGGLRDTYTGCVFLGHSADTSVNNLTNAVAIGYQALVDASNCMVLGGSGANQLSVGIGLTPNAQFQLPTIHANRKIVLYQTANNDHQVDGFGTATGIFRFQLDALTSSYIFNAGVNSTTSNELMRLTGTGFLGIGTSSPSAPLQFANTVVNRKIVLYETANNDHQFFGFGVNNSGLRLQIYDTTSNFIFYAGVNSTTSNELMRLTGAGFLGIGTASPNAQIHLSDTAVNRKIVLYGGVNDHQFYGFGVNNSILRLQVDSTSADFIFYAATSSTTSNELIRIRGNGRVGIGTTIPDQLLTVNTSTPSKITAGSWSAFSDARIKDIVGDYEHGLAEIIQIKTRKFKYNNRSGYPENEQAKVNIGVVAQEIEEIFPECIVEKMEHGDISDMRVYDGTALTYALINAVKELNNEIINLKQQINKR